MELPETLEALQQHLASLVGLLQQEQDLLLNPQTELDDANRLRLEQNKQLEFSAIEALQGKFGALKDVLAAQPRHTAVSHELRKEVGALSDQAVRLYQLNTTLIRQSLVHNQVVLLNLKQIGSVADAVSEEAAAPAVAAPEVEVPHVDAPKTRSRRKSKAAEGSTAH